MPRPKLFSDAILFDSTRTGLARMLGPLEAAIMQVLWSPPQRYTVEQVVQQLADDGMRRRYTTIASTLLRLCEKELLTREKPAAVPVYWYAPTGTQYDFERRVIFSILDRIRNENIDIMNEWVKLQVQKQVQKTVEIINESGLLDLNKEDI